MLTKLLLLLMFASAAVAQVPGVRLGIDRLLDERIDLVRGKKVGLVTNPSGVDGNLVATADRLHADPRVKLSYLFGPEHGIRGAVDAGKKVADGIDAVTGVPVQSLYGKNRSPSQDVLKKLDVLLFDIQDVGSRTYTYVSTLGATMEAAARAKIPMVVLDRPNPLGGTLFEGAIREEQWKSFIGWGPVPVTHGMTFGEIARFYKRQMGIDCALEVVKMSGWRRSMQWEDTGLNWVQTSPHIPHSLHAHLYVATGMIGGVTKNVNEGVGYTLPFETIAAEFLDPTVFTAAMNDAGLPGVRFRPITYKPYYQRHAKKTLHGCQLMLVDRRAFRPLKTALTALVVMERLHPKTVEYKSKRSFCITWGNERILKMIQAGKSVKEIQSSWTKELVSFAKQRMRCLLYD